MGGERMPECYLEASSATVSQHPEPTLQNTVDGFSPLSNRGDTFPLVASKVLNDGDPARVACEWIV